MKILNRVPVSVYNVINPLLTHAFYKRGLFAAESGKSKACQVLKIVNL